MNRFYERSVAGLTLVELMVVLVIIGITAAIATPYYASYTRDGTRGDMLARLTNFSQAAERSFALFGLYEQGRLNNLLPDDIDLYDVAVVVDGNGFAYTVTAEATGRQLDDIDCQVLTYNNLGVRGSQDAGLNDSSAVCWP